MFRGGRIIFLLKKQFTEQEIRQREESMRVLYGEKNNYQTNANPTIYSQEYNSSIMNDNYRVENANVNKNNYGGFNTTDVSEPISNKEDNYYTYEDETESNEYDYNYDYNSTVDSVSYES